MVFDNLPINPYGDCDRVVYYKINSRSRRQRPAALIFPA